MSDGGVFAATVTAMATIIVGLLGLCGVLLRRNNRKPNPGPLDSAAFHQRMDQQNELSRQNREELLGLRGDLARIETLLRERLPPRGGPGDGA